MRLRGARRRGRFLVAVLAVAVTSGGCHFETNDRPPSYVVVNATDETVEIRYLTDRTGLRPDELEDFRSVAELEPGEEYRFTIPDEDRDACLDAPLAALGPDGAEIDRLPTGTCAERYAKEPTWTITG